MEPRHFDQTDEDVSEAPWGAVPPESESEGESKQVLNPKLRAAIQRYRLGRAAQRTMGPIDEPLGPVDAIQPISPVRRVRIN